jgi:hypothetical protein
MVDARCLNTDLVGEISEIQATCNRVPALCQAAARIAYRFELILCEAKRDAGGRRSWPPHRSDGQLVTFGEISGDMDAVSWRGAGAANYR